MDVVLIVATALVIASKQGRKPTESEVEKPAVTNEEEPVVEQEDEESDPIIPTPSSDEPDLFPTPEEPEVIPPPAPEEEDPILPTGPVMIQEDATTVGKLSERKIFVRLDKTFTFQFDLKPSIQGNKHKNRTLEYEPLFSFPERGPSLHWLPGGRKLKVWPKWHHMGDSFPHHGMKADAFVTIAYVCVDGTCHITLDGRRIGRTFNVPEDLKTAFFEKAECAVQLQFGATNGRFYEKDVVRNVRFTTGASLRTSDECA